MDYRKARVSRAAEDQLERRELTAPCAANPTLTIFASSAVSLPPLLLEAVGAILLRLASPSAELRAELKESWRRERAPLAFRRGLASDQIDQDGCCTTDHYAESCTRAG